MAKYDPLRDHLSRQTFDELTMSFTDIRRLVGELPKSTERPQWWSNVRDAQTPRVQRRAWRDAGYDAFLLRGAHKVRFKRVAASTMAVPATRTDPPR